MRLSLARRTEYGIRLLLVLAASPNDTLTAADLAERCEIPAGNVPAILSTLSRAGLVMSSRGRAGGCTLARTPAAISIMEVVQALEGPLALSRCILDSRRCHNGGPLCAVHQVWIEGRDAALAALAQTSLAETLERELVIAKQS